MAKRRRRVTPEWISNRIRQGYGQGEGAGYRPWLTIQDVPSTGLVTRIRGTKTGRVHHLLSGLELSLFYVLEASAHVLDIREQYPLLPLEITLTIAEQLGIQHPRDPRTKQPIVMTTDFLVTHASPSGVRADTALLARAVKPQAALASDRTREKLDIERVYWKWREVDWALVTEREIPRVFARNYGVLRGYLTLDDRLSLSDDEIHAIAQYLTGSAEDHSFVLRDLTAGCDRGMDLQPGTSLAVAYHLLATGQWSVDLHTPLDSGVPMRLLANVLSAARHDLPDESEAQ